MVEIATVNALLLIYIPQYLSLYGPMYCLLCYAFFYKAVRFHSFMVLL